MVWLYQNYLEACSKDTSLDSDLKDMESRNPNLVHGVQESEFCTFRGMILIAQPDLENPASNLYQYIINWRSLQNDFLKYRSTACLFSDSSFHFSMSLSTSLLTLHVQRGLWPCNALGDLWKCKGFSYLKIFIFSLPSIWNVSSPPLALLSLLSISVFISGNFSLVPGEFGRPSCSLSPALSSHPHHRT